MDTEQTAKPAANKVPLKLHLQNSMRKGLSLEELYVPSALQGVVSVYWTL